jgi:predicted DNA-binding transcriptional regulator YafY
MTRATNRATRLTRLRDRLKERPVTVVELARLEGVGRRSIERDLQALANELGETVTVDEQHRYSIAVRAGGLNEVEALALYSAARLLLHTGVGESHYRSAMRKLALQVPEPARTALLTGITNLKTSARDRVLDLVAQAWFQQRVLRCQYRSVNSGTNEHRDLEVYFVEISRQNREPYALAFDRTKRRQVVMFRLSRMQDVRLLDETYSVPDEFDAEAALHGALGVVAGELIEVTVRVDESATTQFREGAAAMLIALDEQPDGSAIARIRATLDSHGRALELRPWLLGWGAAVEVLMPDHLRRDMAEALRAAAERYAASTP